MGPKNAGKTTILHKLRYGEPLIPLPKKYPTFWYFVLPIPRYLYHPPPNCLKEEFNIEEIRYKNITFHMYDIDDKALMKHYYQST